MGTAIKHPVPDRFKPSFVIFDIRALLRSALSDRVPGCQKLQMTAQDAPYLFPYRNSECQRVKMFCYGCRTVLAHMATVDVDVKGF